MTAIITIKRETKTPKADIKILEVQIDTKFKQKLYVKKIQEKMITETQTFTKVTTST